MGGRASTRRDSDGLAREESVERVIIFISDIHEPHMVPTPAATLGEVIPYNSAWSLAWAASYNSAGSLVWHVCETRVCLAWSGRPRRCWGWVYPIRLRYVESFIIRWGGWRGVYVRLVNV